MKMSDAGQAIGQGQNRQFVKNIYTKKAPVRQGKRSVNLNVNFNVNNDMPFVQTGFCHYLRIKNFETGSLVSEKITRQQKRAAEAIVANCLRMPGENIKIAFHKKFFAKGSPAEMSGYGFNQFNAVRKIFEQAGYIETYAPRSFNTDVHPVSWLKGTAKLYGTLASGAVIEYKPDFVALLKGHVKENEPRRYMPFPNPNSPQLRKIRAILEPYHRQLERHKIECNPPDNVIESVYRQHFKQGKAGRPQAPPDVKFKYPIAIFSDDLQSNGRLYNSFWTSCKREYRQFLRIDGDQCVEFDFTAMHPNILYSMENLPPQDDVYIYDKSDIFQGSVRTRDVAKLLMLSLINIDSKRTIKETRSHTISAVITGIKKEKYGVTLKYENVSDLLSEIENRHKPIQRHFYNSAWRYCTKIEADLIREIIRAAMAQNILVLSVHDSIICQVQNMDKVWAIIQSKTRLPFKPKMFN